jgi:two-component system, chemotaxis family, chemotaxis protein CheY
VMDLWAGGPPRGGEPRSGSMARPRAGSDGQQSTVLVVDDDTSILDTVSSILSGEGYDVVSAATGEEALAAVARKQPLLILLDMRMPIMDGWEFARVYRAQPGPHAPIIVLTAARDVANRAAEINADGYLGKPFNVVELLDLVARHTRQA